MSSTFIIFADETNEPKNNMQNKSFLFCLLIVFMALHPFKALSAEAEEGGEVAGDAGESIQNEVPEAGQADEGEAAAQGAEVGVEAAPRAIYAGGTVLVTRQ